MDFVNDHEGERFGRLTVIGFAWKRNGMNMMRCKCDCGEERIVSYSNLKSGNTKSCGCLNREMNQARHEKGIDRRGEKKRTPYQLQCGSSQEKRLKRVWENMHRRCEKQNNPSYRFYGGRGISVCDEWNDFEKFKAWAMENGYDGSAKCRECTLDRIDVNLGYFPGNCRWVRQDAQNINKRNNVLVTFNGETKTIAEWAREIGMEYDTLRKRIVLRGWSPERALTTRV